jgi:acyl carrier protein
MNKFNQIAGKFLSIDESLVRDELTPKDVPEWDSMAFLLFIAELEKEFSMSFTMDQVMNSQSLGDLRKIVEKKD